MKYEDRIIVIDSFPGSGKTSFAIQHINELDNDTKVIYLTPYLDEVKRVLEACKEKNFVQPDSRKGHGSKLTHLSQLIANGQNIVSTHALFSMVTDELINALRVNNYILFLDEVFQTVEKYDIVDGNLKAETKDAITKKDVETLIAKEIISIESDFSIKWIDTEMPLSKYDNLMSMSERGLIYFVNGSLLLWSFPIEVFREGIFSQIFILTHRFESQLQAYYYKYFDLQYEKYMVSFNNNIYTIIKGNSTLSESDWKKSIKDKIYVLEDEKLNRLGNIYYDARNRPFKSSLSKSWYEKNQSLLPVIRNNLVNYFKNITKSKVNERLWTCFKEDVKKIKSKNISAKYWLACNARATNDYCEKSVLAYLINRYIDPFYNDFFERKDITINQDEYALSEMMQWIWRSAIRNGNSIQLYMPSLRMRTLLYNYLNDIDIEF